MYDDLYSQIDEVIDRIKGFDKLDPVNLVVQLSPDGICAASIMVKLLDKLELLFTLSFVPQLTDEAISELSFLKNKNLILVGLGSCKIRKVAEVLKDKEVVVLDHHKPESDQKFDLVHVNPMLHKIKFSEISSAGVVYLLSNRFSLEGVSHLAVIGAAAEGQEDNGFTGLNSEILEHAIQEGLTVTQGLRILSYNTDSLTKALEWCFEPYLRGISGDERGASEFLGKAGVNPKVDDYSKTVSQLSEQDVGKLAEALKTVTPETVVGNKYLMDNWDVSDFIQMLNACCKMFKPSYALGACLGDGGYENKAKLLLSTYKSELCNALRWYNGNKSKAVSGKGYTIINATDKVMSTIIGAFTNVLVSMKEMNNSIILAMAQLEKNQTKVSARIAGDNNNDVDMVNLLGEIVAKTGGEFGGHKHAAGATIATDKEKEFVDAAKEVLAKYSMEEVIA